MADKKFQIKAKVTGTGSYLPERVVTNHDLEKIMDTTDDWIVQRTGIRERRLAGPGECTSTMAEAASRRAIEAAGLRPEDIDLVIAATLSPDYQFPGVGALLQARLGLGSTPSFDIRNQCSGFIYALNVAKLFIESGQFRRVLVAAAEMHSPFMDWTTRGRDMAVLFGDGAGAVVLEASEGEGLGRFILGSDGTGAHNLLLEKPGTAGGTWLDPADLGGTRLHPSMDGRMVYIRAVKELTQVVAGILKEGGVTAADIDHFLFHQANLRINKKVAENLGIDLQKAPSNIDRYGNTSAASLAILFDEEVRNGRIKRGDRVVLAAFGAGFTWGAGILTY